jgi:5-methylcytosine-specific restriction endonuclease McrA
MVAAAIPERTSRLGAAVDALVDESIEGFASAALGEDLVDVRRAIDRLEAEFLRRLHRFHSERGAQSDGGGSTMAWLRRRCAMTVKAAAYRVHLARTLGELPAALDSARAGRASFSNVAMIGHLAEDVGLERLAPMEGILVGAAETLEPGPMRSFTQAVRLRLDPDGVLADDNHAHQQRWFECEATYGGDYILRGLLDAEGGALLKTAIDTLGHGLAGGETRMASTRRADALVELAATQLRCGEHRDVHGQRPHLTLTVSAETLRTGAATGAGARPAELSGVGPIHPATARRIACDAVRTVVTVAAPAADASPWTALTTPVLPLSAAPARRTIPAHLRRALCLRDHGCRFPGCDRPPAWTDGHHIIHWVDGGPTALDNLVSLCRPHHRAVHEQGWRIHIADGVAVVEPPP